MSRGSRPDQPGRIVTFYSYKGGVGRTLALVDTAVLLARMGSRVLVTGDGFMLALPAHGAHDLPLQVCEAARALVSHCDQFVSAAEYARRKLEVRVGLHVGELVVDAVRFHSTSFAVGVGINWCSRVADISGPSQVLASEGFVCLVHQRMGAAVVNRNFFPSWEHLPFEVTVKHRRSAEVRLLEGGALSKEPPPRFARKHDIDAHITNALTVIGRTLVRALNGLDPRRLTEASLAPRLTLWTEADGQLHPIEPRCQLPEAGFSRAGSRTRYEIPVEPDPDGSLWPVLDAYVHNRPAHVLDLPDPSNWPAYVRACVGLGLSRSQVINFSRPARAIIALPMMLYTGRPSGILCIDLLQDISCHAEAIDQFCERIGTRSGYFVAGLLELRGT